MKPCSVKLCAGCGQMFDDLQPESGQARWIDARTYLMKYGLHWDDIQQVGEICPMCMRIFQAAAKWPPAARKERRSGGGPPPVISVITHDDLRRTRIHRFLSERGYTVIIPPHREDVIGMVTERQPDIVILDMYLSGPSGLETLRTLRAQGYRGKIIVMGGISIRRQLQKAFQLGIDDLIGGIQAKNGQLVGMEHVESAIRRLCQT